MPKEVLYFGACGWIGTGAGTVEGGHGSSKAQYFAQHRSGQLFEARPRSGTQFSQTGEEARIERVTSTNGISQGHPEGREFQQYSTRASRQHPIAATGHHDEGRAMSKESLCSRIECYAGHEPAQVGGTNLHQIAQAEELVK